MEHTYPDFLLDKRPIYARGMLLRTEPSERRVEDRKRVYDILHGTGDELFHIDEIINHFREKYEGIEWRGLGKKARIELFLRYKGRCMWCKQKLSMNSFTIEHIVPRIEGGSDELDNMGIAHEECNANRTDVRINKFGYYNDEADRKAAKIGGGQDAL